MRNVRLPSAGLYPVASIATAALAYGAADTLHGSGFLAVYLAGLVLGTATTPARRTIVTFHDGLAWIAQLALFLILGLLVFPEDLGDIALEGTAIALVTAVFARPLATLRRDASARGSAWGSGSCSAGRACAARSRSCSPPSRSRRASRAG